MNGLRREMRKIRAECLVSFSFRNLRLCAMRKAQQCAYEQEHAASKAITNTHCVVFCFHFSRSFSLRLKKDLAGGFARFHLCLCVCSFMQRIDVLGAKL